MIRKIVLFTTMIVILLSTKVNASEIPANQIKNTIVQTSIELGVDPAMAMAIAKVESGYNHSKRSPYGAIGVFQLMPSTAKKMGYNPYHLSDNIRGGITYYNKMYKMFGSVELALAAYNAGPTYILKHRRAPRYTRCYVAKIMSEYNKIKTSEDLMTIVVQQSNSAKTFSHHGTAKPMSASIPRVINNKTNKLIVRPVGEVAQPPKLQVTMLSTESVY